MIIITREMRNTYFKHFFFVSKKFHGSVGRAAVSSSPEPSQLSLSTGQRNSSYITNSEHFIPDLLLFSSSSSLKECVVVVACYCCGLDIDREIQSLFKCEIRKIEKGPHNPVKSRESPEEISDLPFKNYRSIGVSPQKIKLK